MSTIAAVQCHVNGMSWLYLIGELGIPFRLNIDDILIANLGQRAKTLFDDIHRIRQTEDLHFMSSVFEYLLIYVYSWTNNQFCNIHEDL